MIGQWRSAAGGGGGGGQTCAVLGAATGIDLSRIHLAFHCTPRGSVRQASARWRGWRWLVSLSTAPTTICCNLQAVFEVAHCPCRRDGAGHSVHNPAAARPASAAALPPARQTQRPSNSNGAMPGRLAGRQRDGRLAAASSGSGGSRLAHHARPRAASAQPCRSLSGAFSGSRAAAAAGCTCAADTRLPGAAAGAVDLPAAAAPGAARIQADHTQKRLESVPAGGPRAPAGAR